MNLTRKSNLVPYASFTPKPANHIRFAYKTETHHSPYDSHRFTVTQSRAGPYQSTTPHHYCLSALLPLKVLHFDFDGDSCNSIDNRYITIQVGILHLRVSLIWIFYNWVDLCFLQRFLSAVFLWQLFCFLCVFANSNLKCTASR